MVIWFINFGLFYSLLRYHFFILFGATVLMLSFMGWNLIGADSPMFRSFFMSIQSVMMMSIGELPDWEERYNLKNHSYPLTCSH